MFADSGRKGKFDAVEDPLQVIARHIDFGQLAALADDLMQCSDGRKGARSAYPTEVMVRILVLESAYTTFPMSKRSFNCSNELPTLWLAARFDA